MVLANVVLVITFSLGSDFGGALTALGFIGLLLFTVGFTFGFGALVWVYAGESFPARLRSIGASAMLTANLTANAVVAAVFLRLLESLGGAGTFVLFGLLAVAAFGFTYKMAPETKGRPLEDIRHYWENDGIWPAAETGPAVGQREHPVTGRIVGLDVGGSKTHAVLADASGVLAETVVGSANVASVGAREATRQLSAALDQLGATDDRRRLRRRRRRRLPGAARPAGRPDRRAAARRPGSRWCTTRSCCWPRPGWTPGSR